MGIIKSIDDWEADRGEQAGDFIQNSLTAVGKFICGVRQKYPNSFFDRSYGRGLANSICKNFDDEPLEPVPPSFTGGQCVGSTYKVTVQFDRYSGDTLMQSQEVVFNGVPGAISGVVATRTRGNPSVAGVLVTVDPEPSNIAVVERPVGGIGERAVIKDFQVEVINNQPDDCGDTGASFPPDSPRNSDDFKTTENVSEYDEDGNVVFSEDIEIELEEKDEYDFPVCVKVDNKTICLDADGWSVEEDEEEEEEDEEEEEEIEILTWVLVQVLGINEKTKMITRSDEKDSEIFAGYISFAYSAESGDYWLPAIPIRKEFNAFRVKEDSQVYSVYTNFGMQVNVTEVKEKIKVLKEEPEE